MCVEQTNEWMNGWISGWRNTPKCLILIILGYIWPSIGKVLNTSKAWLSWAEDSWKLQQDSFCIDMAWDFPLDLPALPGTSVQDFLRKEWLYITQKELLPLTRGISSMPVTHVICEGLWEKDDVDPAPALWTLHGCKHMHRQENETFQHTCGFIRKCLYQAGECLDWEKTQMCERREASSGSCIQVWVLDSVSFPISSAFLLFSMKKALY